MAKNSNHFQFHWKSGDGLRMLGQGWEPKEPKSIFYIVHGLGEHSGRYAHLAEYLSEAGYVVLSFDLRGHGKSEGKRGHTPSYEALMDDIAYLLEEGDRRYSVTSRFMYGHSLGGNIVLNFALRRKPELSGVVASGPWLKLAFEPPGIKVVLGKIMSHVIPSFSQANGLNVHSLSRDSKVVKAYLEDPLVHDKITAGLFVGTYESGLWALENAGDFPLPLLITHGTSDKITSMAASKEFAKRAGAKCTLKLWEGSYHEVHNEPESLKVFEYVKDWIESY